MLQGHLLNVITKLIMQYGTPIRIERSRLKMTQETLAKLSNIPLSTLSRLENGQRTSFATVARVCNALKMTSEIEFC